MKKKIADLENMIAIQRDCNEKGYMHGMLNGLICAHAVIADCTPKYVAMPYRKVKVRHKSRKPT